MKEDSSSRNVLISNAPHPFRVCLTCINMYCLVSVILLVFAFLVLKEHGYSLLGFAAAWIGFSILVLMCVLFLLTFFWRHYMALGALLGVCFSGTGWNFLVAAFAAFLLCTQEHVTRPAPFFSIVAVVSVPFLILIDRLAAQMAWENRVKSGTIDLENGLFEHTIPPFKKASGSRRLWWQAGTTWAGAVWVAIAIGFRGALTQTAGMALLTVVSIAGYFLFMGIGWTYGFGLAVRAWAYEHSTGKTIRIHRTKRPD